MDESDKREPDKGLKEEEQAAALESFDRKIQFLSGVG